MVVLLRGDVFQDGFELAWTGGKRAITALPEKAAVACINGLYPLRRRFLRLFDELRLGNSSRQGGDDMNVIGCSADARQFCAEVAANRCQIRMHARPDVGIERRLSVFCAENDVEDDVTEGLGHDE